MTNLEKGGKEYMAWIRGLAKLCGSDPMYDIHLYDNDKLFDVWESGISYKEFFNKAEKRQVIGT